MKNYKLAASRLASKFVDYVDYWDCYNDEPNKDPNPEHCAVIYCKGMMKELKSGERYDYYKNILKELRLTIKQK